MVKVIVWANEQKIRIRVVSSALVKSGHFAPIVFEAIAVNGKVEKTAKFSSVVV
jgi:hypothetical protein